MRSRYLSISGRMSAVSRPGPDIIRGINLCGEYDARSFISVVDGNLANTLAKSK